MKTARTVTALLLTSLTLSQTSWGEEKAANTCSDISTASSQKQQYCKAYKTANKAAKTNGLLWKIYGGVTAICTAQCVSSMASMGIGDIGSYACLGSSAAAGVADGVMTKNFMTAAAAIGGAGVGLAFNKGWIPSPFGGNKGGGDAAAKGMAEGMPSKNEYLSGLLEANVPAEKAAEMAKDYDKTLATQADKGTDWGSCISAATSAYTTFTKKQSESQEKKTAKENLNAAQQVDSVDQQNRVLALDSGSVKTTTGGLDSSPQGGGGVQGLDGGNANDPADACGNATNLAGAVQCAAMADSSLAAKISDPRFAEDFKKVSGMSFDDYLKKSDGLSGSAAIAGAMGGALSPSGIGQMQAALASMEQRLPDFNSDPGAMYAGGGGPSGSSNGPDVNSIINGVMSQFGPKKEDGRSNGVNEVNFGARGRRGLASASAEDPTVSIFDRATFRYGNISARWAQELQGGGLKSWGKTN